MIELETKTIVQIRYLASYCDVKIEGNPSHNERRATITTWILDENSKIVEPVVLVLEGKEFNTFDENWTTDDYLFQMLKDAGKIPSTLKTDSTLQKNDLRADKLQRGFI